MFHGAFDVDRDGAIEEDELMEKAVQKAWAMGDFAWEKETMQKEHKEAKLPPRYSIEVRVIVILES